MEHLTIILFTSSAALLLTFLILLITRRRINLPPSPPSLPIIGHLHLLKHPVYRLYHRLSRKYGPIFSLRFGSRRVVVVASAALVEECFTKNDIVLANRPRTIGGKHLAYDHTTMAAASYGDHWRNLRRIGAVEIFSSARLNTFLNIRTDEIRRLLLSLSRESRDEFARVQLRPLLTDLTFNNIMRMVAGKRYYGKDITGQEEEEAKMFRDLITQAFLLGGAANPREFLPILNWIRTGKQSYEQKVKNMAESFDGLLQGLVDERRGGEKSNTMIDHLLSLQESQQEYYTDQIIKGLIFVLLLAGTDTSAVTLEWAMANLLNHPNVLKKVRDELETQIGQEKLVEEQDIAKLPYLQNVIWETMRLYPAAPMLLPHVASADCKIGGYDVPRETMVVVNAWAIHRDPAAWEDAESFKPERFEKDEQRESHKMIPFGLGRRACPGASLAQRVIALALGSMIQCFDWEKTDEDDGQIDMSEGTGTTMPKAQPLEALCRPRPIVHRLLYDAA